MSRVALASIPALTFYKDSVTLSRRTSPIQQLVCLGKPCNLYTPDVVRCENIGGSADQVDWKCEADLPDSLRFGRVEVSCEGWSKPGDPYVLKGSCGLEYRLIQIPKGLREDSGHSGIPPWFQSIDIARLLFLTLWLGVLLLVAYNIIKSCLRTNSDSTTRRNPRPPNTRSGGSGWFPGDHRDDDSMNSPPPYSKNSSQSSGWRPGFWTGAAVGTLGASLFNNRGRARPPNQTYDWERERSYPSPLRSDSNLNDRGEGSSNLGPMRRSTGLGGSNVR